MNPSGDGGYDENNENGSVRMPPRTTSSTRRWRRWPLNLSTPIHLHYSAGSNTVSPRWCSLLLCTLAISSMTWRLCVNRVVPNDDSPESKKKMSTSNEEELMRARCSCWWTPATGSVVGAEVHVGTVYAIQLRHDQLWRWRRHAHFLQGYLGLPWTHYLCMLHLSHCLRFWEWLLILLKHNDFWD